MVRVIIDYCPSRLSQPEFEAAFRALECSHGFAYVVVVDILSCEEACADSSDSIFDIDVYGYTEVNAGDCATGSHEVKRQVALCAAYVGGMEVALVAGVGVHFHSGTLPGL